MPWTTPGTATAGSVLTAAFWNEQVRDNMNVLRAMVNVQQAVKTDTTSSTSSSFADIAGLSVTITPTFNTSKILLAASVQVGISNTSYWIPFRFTRDGTAIGIADAAGVRTRATFEAFPSYLLTTENASFEYLDSPATVSAVTYKLQWAIVGGVTGYLNRGSDDIDNAARFRTISTLIAREIPV